MALGRAGRRRTGAASTATSGSRTSRAAVCATPRPSIPSGSSGQGDALLLHPKQPPPLPVVEVARAVTSSPTRTADRDARAAGKPWVAGPGLPGRAARPAPQPLDQPLTAAPSRTIWRRASASARLLEPIGFAMDRRMLLGIKERAEGAAGR